MENYRTNLVEGYKVEPNLALVFDVLCRKQELNMKAGRFTCTMNELKDMYHLTSGKSTKCTQTLVKMGFVYSKREGMGTRGTQFYYTVDFGKLCQDEYLSKIITPNTPTYKALQSHFKALSEVQGRVALQSTND